MIGTLLILSLLLALDSFVVGASLGPLQLSPSRRRWLAASFGLCDGLAVFLGSVLLGSVLGIQRVREAIGTGGWFAPVAAFAYGAYMLYLGWRSRAAADQPDRSAGGWIMFGLPVCLSLDNLMAGAALGGSGMPIAIAAGLSASLSGLMAFSGLWLGEAVGKRLPVRPAFGGGVALVAAAVALALM